MRAFAAIAAVLILAALSGCASIIGATTDKPIRNDVHHRTLGEWIDDEAIETKALVNLRKASEALRNSHLVVVSYNGIVLLAGQVPSADAKQLATATVNKIRDVRSVDNELSIGPPTGFVERSADAYITTKLKAKLLTVPHIDPSTIKVVTEHGVVYLMGLVSRKTADIAVNEARNTGGVQKVVRIFEYTD